MRRDQIIANTEMKRQRTQYFKGLRNYQGREAAKEEASRVFDSMGVVVAEYYREKWGNH